MSHSTNITRAIVALCAFVLSASAAAQTPDLQAVARNLVQAGMVKTGDRVLINGSVRDIALLEHIAVETMKAGGQPLITLGSEQLTRRSFDEVPAAYDTLTRTLGVAMANTFDVRILIDVGESEDLLASVPLARRTARAKSAQPVNDAWFRHNRRLVNLGNGMYPTATLAKRLGLAQTDLTAVFWKGAGVPPQTIRAGGETLRNTIARGRQITLTHPNGTNLSFGVDAGHAFLSDGAITPDKVKQGAGAASTWLPAGELIFPAAAGTAEGKVVIDKTLWDGKVIQGLTLTFSKGRLTAMTAASNIDGLKGAYDAAGDGKDQFGYIDIGLNPETPLPVGTGHIVWTAPGAITVGLGDNRGFGGTNASDFGFAGQLGGATIKVDGTVALENGALR